MGCRCVGEWGRPRTSRCGAAVEGGGGDGGKDGGKDGGSSPEAHLEDAHPMPARKMLYRRPTSMPIARAG